MAEDGEKKESESKKHTYPLVRVSTFAGGDFIPVYCLWGGDFLWRGSITQHRHAIHTKEIGTNRKYKGP